MYFKEVREQYPDWKAVQVFSYLSPWIDCVVFVPAERIDDCVEACYQGLSDYWKYQFETYGDCLANQLEEYDVPYLIVFGELNWDQSNTTEAWDEAVSQLTRQNVLICNVT